jgi:type VII secretion integral membrane protein EccD
MSYAAELCRLTVVTPNNVVELAVPATAPIVDFLPAVLSFGGRDLADRGLAHDGWVLQRLGGPPLPESHTLREAQVLDGETLYLAPRRAAAPEAVFDDLVDGLATAVREREDRLREAAARWSGPVSGGVLLATALAALATSGAGATRAQLAAAVAVLLVAGSALAARVLRSAAGAAVLGLGAVGYAAAAGWWAAGTGHGAGTAGAALWAALAALGAVAVARPASGAAIELFAGTAVVAAGVALGAGTALAAGLSLVQAAAVVAVVATGFVVFVPSWSFHLAGLRLPPLPTTAADIRRTEEPVGRQQLWQAAAAVDRLMAAFLTASGVLAVGSAAVSATGPGLAPVLAATTGLALLLRARAFVRTPLKLLARAAGVLALAVAGGLRAAQAGGWQGLAVAGAALLLGLGLTVVRPGPAKERPPYAARAAEVFEYLAVGALVPLALAVTGVFGWARGIG